jgi:hypothetical protein
MPLCEPLSVAAVCTCGHGMGKWRLHNFQWSITVAQTFSHERFHVGGCVDALCVLKQNAFILSVTVSVIKENVVNTCVLV